MKLLEYALPVLTLIVIAAFFMFLPDVRYAELKESKKAFGKRDSICCLAITAVYAVAAFTNLGNTASPQTFLELNEGNVTVVELEETCELEALDFFTGITVGSFQIDVSEDGERYEELLSFETTYDRILKWQSPGMPEKSAGPVRFIRFTGLYGSPRIGELSAVADGKRVGLRACGGEDAEKLCDEQDLVPESESCLNSSYFDEIYHVRTAEEHIERMNPYEISHPPLGKIILSLGIRTFGLTPFGWRFTGTLFGVLMVPAMYMFLHLLFNSTSVSCCGTVLLATDFMHFTQTRIATIDSYAVFFVILMYLFMYRFIDENDKKSLALSGLFFGIGCACKWTCVYAGAGLGIIWLLFWLHRLFSDAKQGKNSFAEFSKNAAFCVVFFVLLPAVIYYVSYIPYGLAKGLRFPGMLFSRDYAGIVIDNQKFMFNYHVGVNAEHPYSSVWYQWVLDIRPILYYLRYFEDGTRSSIGAFVNPALCWGGLIAVMMLAVIAVSRRDKTAAFIVMGYLAQLLPWVFVKRILFEYHYFACTVFLVLAMGYVFSLMKEMKHGKAFCIAYTALSLCLFIIFYPVLSGTRVSGIAASSLMGWLPTWPF